ncbi:MAG TPA: aminodeoxychorismate synthase component I, partial [Cyclobacteriaceae bacterium]|nr:aminodeoxychorismate synthase component I [Cyclobacteriaceae bacterium]
PISFEEYKKKFNKVFHHLSYGDSFLTNLTVKTRIETNNSLRQLFESSNAKYKILYKDEFLVFSPESFVQIKEGFIHSYPMKGTIDAAIPDAESIILNSEKELAEHITIVDLIRSDLSRVAASVDVKRFRYVDEIRTHEKNLLQVSSEITGKLPADYQNHLGDILLQLLPAGSITGAPKPKTIEVIHETEQEKRGYFTGVFGYFDGTILDSGVMIRYIEREGDQFVYRSGGGVTTRSKAESEYREVLDKIYVPVD